MEVISLNKKLVKIIAAVLSVIMIVTILPFSAFAKIEGNYLLNGTNIQATLTKVRRTTNSVPCIQVTK